jgi:hypothetical protein
MIRSLSEARLMVATGQTLATVRRIAEKYLIAPADISIYTDCNAKFAWYRLSNNL